MKLSLKGQEAAARHCLYPSRPGLISIRAAFGGMSFKVPNQGEPGVNAPGSPTPRSPEDQR